MTHLTPDELVDAVEGTLAASRHAHVADCVACREQTSRLSAVLRDARAIEVPEPSPLFWDRFSARVHQAIAAADAPSRGWMPQWLRLPVLVPLGVLALLIMALAIAVSRGPGAPDLVISSGTPDVAMPDLAASGIEGWAVVSELVGPIDLESALDAGILVGPGTADLVALDLSSSEQTELVRLLKEEMSLQ